MHTQRATITKAFRALGDDTRLAILRTLARQRCESVDALVEAVNLPRSTVSHGLQLLHQAGLVDYDERAHGRGPVRHEYFIANEVLEELLVTMQGLAKGAKNDEAVKVS